MQQLIAGCTALLAHRVSQLARRGEDRRKSSVKKEASITDLALLSTVNFIFVRTRSPPRSTVIAIENLVSRLHCLAERMHISHVRYPYSRCRRRRRRCRVSAAAC